MASPCCTPRDRLAVAANAPLVLLVDDEPGVLRAAERGIIADGMRVLTAASGRQALALLAEHADMAVVITDQTMPDMTGLTLAGHVRMLRPGMPIVLSTGYTGHVMVDHLRESHIDAMLDKPYTPTQLAEAMQGALRTGRRRAALRT